MTCHKIPYPTLRRAGEALLAISRSSNAGRRECGVHPCSSCHAWHLTSSHGADGSRWTLKAVAQIRKQSLASTD